MLAKRAAIYARVSTEKQEKEKTIESQLEELRRFCVSRGFIVVKEYVDNGWSGETLARPGLDKLRDDAAKKLFNIVCIHSPDRLARKFIYQGLVIEELKKKGIKVMFLNRPIGNTPEDQLLLGVQGLIAEYEKAKILERTRRGKLHKARSGKLIGGLPPYGYRYVKDSNGNGRYVIDEREAEVVRLIFNLYLQLRSVRAVARKLLEMGIKPRRGIAWRTSTLHRILRNEAYIGTTYFNKTYGVPADSKRYSRRVNTSRRFRSRSEWIPIKVPAILDLETFSLAQEILRRNHRERASTRYLLSGLVVCGNCGSTFSGEKSHGYRFYRCNNRHRTFPLPRECNARMISAEKLENAIWKTISNAILKPQILVSHVLKLIGRLDKSKKTLEKEKAKLIASRNLLQNKKDRLIEAYTSGTLRKEEFLRKIEEYRNREEEINTKLMEMEGKLKRNVDKQPLMRNVAYFCNLAMERIKSMDFNQKRDFLRLLIDKIIFFSHHRKAIIKGHIPIIEEPSKNPPYLRRITGTEFTMSWNHEQYPNKWLKFELEVRC